MVVLRLEHGLGVILAAGSLQNECLALLAIYSGQVTSDNGTSQALNRSVMNSVL
jgi:hypothetical protein